MKSILAGLRRLTIPWNATSPPYIFLGNDDPIATAIGLNASITFHWYQQLAFILGVDTTGAPPVGRLRLLNRDGNGVVPSAGFMDFSVDTATNLSTIGIGGGSIEDINIDAFDDIQLATSSGDIRILPQGDLYLQPTAGRINVYGDPVTLTGRSMPRGAMNTPTSTSVNGTPTVAAVETRDAVLGNTVFTSEGLTRRYRVTISGLVNNGSVAGDQYTLNIRDGGAAVPTAVSPLITTSHFTAIAAGGAGRNNGSWSYTFTATAGTHTLAFFALRIAGAGVYTPVGTRELYVEDIGEA